MINEPVHVETRAVNGNEWWITYQPSLLAYEVQINEHKKKILVGWGPTFPGNTILSCAEFLEDIKLQEFIKDKMTDKVLTKVINRCKDLCR